MTHEDKDLLLKDLCARLPYGVKYECSDTKNIWKLNAILTKRQDDGVFLDIYNPLDLCKPYLFPLSSMTEEQKIEHAILWENTFIHHINGYMNKLNEFYKENHLDNNGLIPKDLAIDCTNLNIY